MNGLAVALIFAASQTESQTCPEQSVCGHVTDERGGGIEGAEVAIGEATTTTDSSGRFVAATTNGAPQAMFIKADGYEAVTLDQEAFLAGGKRISLTPEAVAGGDIVVVARRFSLPFSRQSISKIELLTDPIANADALLAVAGLPTATNLDNSADVQLRGSAVGLSRIYYNDVPLYEAVRGSSVDQVTRVSSIFNASLIRTVETYPTLPPAYLANSAAGAVRILPDVERSAPSSLFVGLPGATVSGAGELLVDGEYQAYASVTDLTAMLAVNPSLRATTHSFRSASAGAAAKFLPNGDGELNFLSVVDVERGKYPLRVLNLSGLSTSRRLRSYSVASFETPIGEERVKFDAALTTTHNRLDYLGETTSSRNLYAYGNVDVAGQGLDGRFDYRAGISGEYFRLASAGLLGFGSDLPAAGRIVRMAQYGAAHAFLTFRPSTALTLAAGTRQYFGDDPGQRASYSVAATLTSEDRRQKLIVGAGTFGALVPPELGATSEIAAARSRQASVDYEYNGERVSLRAGTYIKSDELAGKITRIEGVDGSAELRLSPSTLISASFARSKQRSRGFRGERDLDYLVRLQARIALSSAVSVNATYTMKSGAPYTRLLAGQDNGFGGFFPIFDANENGEKLRSYRTLDINIVGQLPLGSVGRHPIVFVSITNLFDRKNEARPIYAWDFSAESRAFYDRRAVSFGIVGQF